MYIYIYTVKLASTTTSLKRPLALNDRFKSPRGYSLYILPRLSDHLLDATNDHEILSLRVNGPLFNGHFNA